MVRSCLNSWEKKKTKKLHIYILFEVEQPSWPHGGCGQQHRQQDRYGSHQGTDNINPLRRVGGGVSNIVSKIYMVLKDNSHANKPWLGQLESMSVRLSVSLSLCLYVCLALCLSVCKRLRIINVVLWQLESMEKYKKKKKQHMSKIIDGFIEGEGEDNQNEAE